MVWRTRSTWSKSTSAVKQGFPQAVALQGFSPRGNDSAGAPKVSLPVRRRCTAATNIWFSNRPGLQETFHG